MVLDRFGRAVLGACALVIGATACNAAIGAGAFAVVGTAGYFAARCYDHVRVRVRDAATGLHTCEAEVTAAEGGSERELGSCYYATLTEGHWALTARREGYLPSSTEIEIPEHEGSCPRYTHSVELTLWPVGQAPPPASRTAPAPSAEVPATAPSVPAPAAPPPAVPQPSATQSPEPGAAPPAPPPSAVPSSPPVPTRSFGVAPGAADPPAADAGAPP